eukprot:m.88569 g.88569  ORF g.88569 m.88569 type:complete len:194 (+) comp26212_c0_seq1:126-707(+)
MSEQSASLTIQSHTQTKYDGTTATSIFGSVAPHRTPPALECITDQRSHRGQYTISRNKADVLQSFIKTIETIGPDESSKKYTLKILGYTESQLFVQRTMGNGIPFRDDVHFDFNTQGEQTQIDVFSTAIDAHFWSACFSPCCNNAVGRYLACFVCCCGLFPTKDWGENGKLVARIVKAAFDTLNKGIQQEPAP